MNSNVADSNFIPGNQDPADLCARYVPFSILKDTKIWFYGPEQSNQFIKSDQCKVNIDDKGLQYNYLVYTVQNLTENRQTKKHLDGNAILVVQNYYVI